LRYSVTITPEAQSHLEAIYTYIADQASAAVADRFTSQILDYCEGFDMFPERGARRDDLRFGLRIVGYRRRASIAFEVEDDQVSILGIYYGGADFEADFRDEAEN